MPQPDASSTSQPEYSPLGRLPARSPLVGRRGELEYLRAEFDAVAAGHGGRLILLRGEPGVGKTRLARELGAYAQASGALFLESYYLRDGTPSYGPWVDALRAGLHRLPPDDLIRIGAACATELAPFFPELQPFAKPPTAPTGLSPEEQRRRLFDAFAGLLGRLAEQAPIVLLLDDLQWAPGLNLLVHTARRLPEMRVLLVGAYRDQEFRERAELLQDWAELNRLRLAGQLSLHRLTAAETTELIGHYFGNGPAEQLQEAVHRRTGGNAFFVEEVVRSLTETGAVHPTEQGWEVADLSRVSIPESMKLAVEDRVARLGETFQDVLTRAAVLGQEFSFPVLLAMAERPEEDIGRIVDQAVAARILIERSRDGEDRFAFLDDQIQEVLYDCLFPLRRRRFHSLAGQALEHCHPAGTATQLEELARHFIAGGDLSKGITYSMQAGDYNERLFNWSRAFRNFAQAAEKLRRLPDTNTNRENRIRALVKLVSVSHTADDLDTNLARLIEAESLVARDVAEAGALEARWLRTQVQYWLGRLHYYRNDPGAAVGHFRASVAGAQDIGARELEAIASSGLGRVAMIQGHFRQGTEILNDVIPQLEADANWPEWITAMAFRAFGAAGQGRFAAARAAANHALSVAQQGNDQLGIAQSLVAIALAHLLADKREEFLAASLAAVEAGERSGGRQYHYIAYGLRAWAEGRLGRQAAAEESLEQYKAISRSFGRQFLLSDWFSVAEAEIRFQAGNFRGAVLLAEKAVEHARTVGGIFAEGLALRIWVQAWLAQDARAELSRAEEQLALSLRCFEAGGAWQEGARTRVIWGLFCRDQGDVQAARDHWEKAEAQFNLAELPHEVETVRALLRALPTSRQTGSSPPSEYWLRPAGLTLREVEVLRLVARGRTNREIAAELVVSVPTVERHVANIYAKIGASGRAEAIAFALRNGIADP